MGVHFDGPQHSGFRHRGGDVLRRARASLQSSTALSPSRSDRRKRGALVFDSLEKRYLLSADVSPYADALDDGLDRLELLVGDLQNFAEFAADIPVLGESLAEAANLAQTLQTELLDPLRALIAGAVGTFEDLEAQIELLGGVTSNLVESGTEAKIEIEFDKTLIDANNPFDFGAAAAQFGFAINADFDFTIDLAFDFAIGILFDPGLSPADAVFIDSGAVLTLAGMADLDAAASGDVVKVGLLGDAGFNAETSFEIKASVTATITENPADDGRITLDELDAAGLALVATQINAADTGFTVSTAATKPAIRRRKSRPLGARQAA